MKVKTFDISIHIHEFSESAAMKKLQSVAEEIIEEGTRCCSEHPAKIEPYLPETYFSCGKNMIEISKEWLEDYTEEEIKEMRFEEMNNAKKTI